MIHPTALIHPGATVPSDVAIGPWCVVEDNVTIGSGSALGAFCRIHSGSELGENVRLDGGAVIGGVPQDQKYRGEPSRTILGRGTRVGEYATINRSSTPGGATRVGEGCLVMAYAHVAHDCELGNGAVLANAAHLGGHVRMGSGAIVSGMTGVHQFSSIGAGAFVGGGLRVDQDVPPYCRALGSPLRWGGLNLTGLRRRGAEDASKLLEGFYRRLYNGSGETDALEWLKGQAGFQEQKAAMVDFFAHRTRAMLRRGAAH